MADDQTYECFSVTSDGGVAHIVLNRPEAMNAMNLAFWAELPSIVRELDAAGRTRVIVISSTGKHFSAGMDLAVFAGGGGDGGDGLAPSGSGRSREEGRTRAFTRELVLRMQGSFTALEQTRMPVLAAVHGGCVGGAVDLITACDLRYCTEDAWFCVQEINIGITADVGTLQRLPKVIPEGIAREMAYRGHRLPSERAYQVGLVNDVFPNHDALVAGVLDVAAEIASKSPLAVYGSKHILNYSRDHSVREGLEYTAAWQSGMFQPADMLENFAAKGEQRDPVFDDLLPKPKDF